MGEFLKQVPKLGDDKVETTGEGLDTLALEVDKESFNKLVKNLSETLSKKIDDEGIPDENVKLLVENSNEDLSDLVNDFGKGTIKNFDQFNEEFDSLFAGVNLDNYINEAKAQNTFAQKAEMKSGNLISNWVNKSANEIAKNDY
ncbi:MAG: hypothetical protein PHS49_02915 [Candidatus Gracilibacteria bacterium]|nr:hypothetical protein [Candidatus Gracilibacteria bacterium]